jgi:hypothetical protein
MFESIVSKLTKTVRNAVRAAGTAVNKSPWIVPVALLVVFFLA